MALMYLDLPGFQKETEKRLNLQQTGGARILSLSRSLTQRQSQSPKPYERYKLRSETLDDRISWIVFEINVGKRDPHVREIAAGIVKSIPPRQWEQTADSCFEYTRNNVRYTLDPYEVELFQTAKRSLQLGIGDCDDQTILLGSLLACVGFPVRLRVIGMKGSDQFQHIYLLAGLPPTNPAKWKPLDPSRPERAGWELPASQRGLLQDFDVEDYDPE